VERVARRRRRRKNSNDGLLLLIGTVFLGAAVLDWAPRFIAAHATAIILAAVALVAVVIVVGALVIRARLRQAAQQAERDRNIAVTDAMTGPLFEQYVARLMRRDGLRRVQVCGGSGDLGADITAHTGDGRKVVVQCKRYAGSVGDPHVQKFNGTAWQIHGADVALLVTTGRPTVKARQLAQRCGIVLVDRDGLAAWATDRILPAALSAPAKSARSATAPTSEQLRLESETP
jgi:restriction system protein